MNPQTICKPGWHNFDETPDRCSWCGLTSEEIQRHAEVGQLRERAEKAEVEVARLTGALLDVQHSVDTAEIPLAMIAEIDETIMATIGAPPYPYEPRKRGEPARRTTSPQPPEKP